MTTQILQYEPFHSAVAPTFWHQLGRRKLEVYKLDQTEQSIVGHYECAARAKSGERHLAAPAQFTLDGEAFEECTSSTRRLCSVTARGLLFNTNTIDEFKAVDKQALLQRVGQQVAEAIDHGSAWDNPGLLCTFVVLAFADLKRHRYVYWCGFPAIPLTPPAKLLTWTRISEQWQSNQITSLHSALHAMWQRDGKIPPLFGISLEKGDSVALLTLREMHMRIQEQGDKRLIFGIVDPSGLNGHPGWPLRNLLTLLAHTGLYSAIQVLCYRDNPAYADESHSIIAEISVPDVSGDGDALVKMVGWEKNALGKLAPCTVNLASTMDPRRLADTAVDLNLKLMRWRLAPALQLEKLAETRCLILGAGTLGCYVARCLLGWGVRKITFVDNAVVSFSNPARQPLYTYEDSLNGGRPKAQCAADNLIKVFPGVESVGHQLLIPMPGHPEVNDDVAQARVAQLSELIGGHDAVFLLMDSRESRWLPTLLSAHYGKLVVNAALGFDTFLVMRHGVPSLTPGEQLGCYYCNDVVAPTDSLHDRSLDQQCTVTRPGLAAIAGALAVELLVSLLHHPLGASAPAALDPPEVHDRDRPLGVIPHQIRGQLASFRNTLVHGPAFDRCTACSVPVLQAYKEQGYVFLRNVFSDPTTLEKLTGLDQLLGKDLDDEWDIEAELASDDSA